MYIENGIAYAGDKSPAITVCGIRALSDYKLWIRFSNGEAKEFDFKPLLSSPAFLPLKDEAVFKDVYIDFGCPVWKDGEIDIAPEYLYEHGLKVG
ncbi:MAG: DUF2442 domain-containing protein [Ruminococcaceae bacterium]|nr:DUF2442 domain-containing protein [Oscillospiraceae bacterium]